MGYVDDSAEASQEPSATGLSVVRSRPTPRRRFLPPYFSGPMVRGRPTSSEAARGTSHNITASSTRRRAYCLRS